MKFRRTLALKNVIMRILIEQRERRERPKLRDLVEVYKQRKSDNIEVSSLREKFMLLYNQATENNEQKDDNFNTLMSGFNRVHEQLGHQQEGLQRLITEVNRLIDRRDKNESKMKVAMEKGRIAETIRKSREVMQQREKMASVVMSQSSAVVQQKDDDPQSNAAALDQNLIANMNYLNENEEKESSNVERMLEQNGGSRNSTGTIKTTQAQQQEKAADTPDDPNNK